MESQVVKVDKDALELARAFKKETGLPLGVIFSQAVREKINKASKKKKVA